MTNAITWHFFFRMKGLLCLAVGWWSGERVLAIPAACFLVVGILGELLDGSVCVVCRGCGELGVFNAHDTAASFGWSGLKRLGEDDDPHATHVGLCIDCRAVEIATGRAPAGQGGGLRG